METLSCMAVAAAVLFYLVPVTRRARLPVAAPFGLLMFCSLAATLIVLPLANKAAAASQDRMRHQRVDASINVLEVSQSRYRPATGMASLASEAKACAAWSLEKQQVVSFFSLSREILPDTLHDFYWLPCFIEGRALIDGKNWEFEINGAGTSIWRNGNEVQFNGCAHKACEALIILAPESND